MSTVAVRLAGPLQAWPSHSRGTRRPTHRAPTYSGLSGLFAAALGRPRSDATDPLADHTVVVRIDRVPRGIWDFHSINPTPSPQDRFQRTRQRRPQMLKMSGGPYSETVLTYRQYLADGCFVCLVEGQAAARLGAALASPRWATFLGRKSCTPAADLLLGIFEEGATDLLAGMPVVDDAAAGEKVSREVHWLAGQPDVVGDVEEWVDQPSGPVGAGYRARPRTTIWQEFQSVSTAQDLRAWVLERRMGVAT